MVALVNQKGHNSDRCRVLFQRVTSPHLSSGLVAKHMDCQSRTRFTYVENRELKTFGGSARLWLCKALHILCKPKAWLVFCFSLLVSSFWPLWGRPRPLNSSVWVRHDWVTGWFYCKNGLLLTSAGRQFLLRERSDHKVMMQRTNTEGADALHDAYGIFVADNSMGLAVRVL
jgi:hypothetical protein